MTANFGSWAGTLRGRVEKSHVSELSPSADSELHNGPESCYVVDAVDALLRDDLVGARMALIQGADLCGWPAVAHRLDVAGRALALDAGVWSGDRDEILVLPDLDTSAWAGPTAEDDAFKLLGRWAAPEPSGDLPSEMVWSSLALVTWFVDRAGYPAEVVV